MKRKLRSAISILLAVAILIGCFPEYRASAATTPSPITSIAAGDGFSIAVKSTSGTYGWGAMVPIGIRTEPAIIGGQLGVSVVVAGKYGHYAFVNSTGLLKMWGYNQSGQIGLGNNSTNVEQSEVTPKNITNVKSVATGQDHTIALTTDGKVWAWGSNYYGQLGRAPAIIKDDVPKASAYMFDAIQVQAGKDFSAALKSDGTVYTAGNNSKGQLGTSYTTGNLYDFLVIPDFDHVVSIAAGYQFMVALKSDGTVWTWGNNTNGELGDGTTTQRTKPVQVMGLTNVMAISAGGAADGYAHALAIKEDGTVWAWGANSHGQLGNNTRINSTTPVQVLKDDGTALTGIIQVSAGGKHSLALGSDGKLWGWGSNEKSELGRSTDSGKFTYSTKAILIGSDFGHSAFFPPKIQSLTPANQAVDVSEKNAGLFMIFNKNVTAVPEKYIKVYKQSDGSEVEKIAVTTTSRVTVYNNQVQISLSQNLSSGTKYYVLVDSGAFKGTDNTVFPGILSETEWQFTTIPAYTVTLDSQGGSSVSSITALKNTTIQVPASPVRTGYNFSGWFKDSTATQKWNFTSDKVLSDLTLYAGWNPKQYYILFQGVPSIPMMDVKYGEDSAPLPLPGVTPPAGKVFAGWNTKSDGTGTTYPAGSKVTNVTDNLFLYTKWDDIQYSISFNINGGAGHAPSDMKVNQGATSDSLPDHTGITAPSGKNFGGWNTKEDGTGKTYAAGDKLVNVTSSVVLYAKWNTILYTVSFDSLGGSSVGVITNVVSGRTVTAPAAPTRSGYIFAGWYKDVELTNAWNFAVDTVTNETTLFAKWSTPYTVSFNSLGGSAVAAIGNVASGATITAPSAPTRNGYTFVGWYKDVELTNAWNFAVDTVTNETTLFAKWSTPYTISFNSLGGSAVAAIGNVASGATITAPSAPTRNGYAFVGWYKDIELTNAWNFAVDTVTSDITLYAKWLDNTPRPAPGFDPKPEPRPGGTPGTPGIPDVQPGVGNHLMVKVSSSIIATPNKGDAAPTGSGVIDPYTAGSDIPGTDAVVNRFIGLYEVDSNNKVVRFTLIVLNPEDVKPGTPTPAPVPGFDPKPEPTPGGTPGTSGIPDVQPGVGNHLLVKVSSSIIATPNKGDAAPTGSGVIDPYTAGSDIPGTDAVVNRYIGLYEVDSNNKVVKFTLIVLNPEDVKPGTPTPAPVPGFDPKPEPRPGGDPGTPGIPDVQPGVGNHLMVKVSSSIIATPNKGDAAPMGSGVIDPYTAGSDIPGTDAVVNRYIGLYEVDSNNKVVKFTLIVLNPEDVKPGTPTPAPVPGFDPKPEPTPGGTPGTSGIPDVQPGVGNHLLVKVSSSIIATPNKGDAAPTGSGVIDPYTAGSDIPGTDAVVNRYIGLYEVDSNNKVVKFTLIVLNPEDVKPGTPTPAPVPGFDPKPEPRPGGDPGTTGIPGATPGTGNHLRVKVSSVMIATPNVGDDAPNGAGIINPYTAGDDIPGVDTKVNRYVGVYEVTSAGKVVKFRLIVLSEGDINPEPKPVPVPGFTPIPEPEPGTEPGTTGIPNVTPEAGNHLRVKVSSVMIATPNVGDDAPKGTGIINPYTAGDDIPGVDAKVNRYVGVYEVTSAGKVVKFRLIVLSEGDVNPEPKPVPVPGFTPVPEPKPGTEPGTTGIPNVTPETGNHLRVKVSSVIIATPNVGDDAPSGTDTINPYLQGADIPGVDAKVNRYIGLYEVDASGKVVRFQLIGLNEEDLNSGMPQPDPAPVPGFTPIPKPEPGTQPGTTGIPNVTPGTDNHLVVKVSSVIIATPNVGDNAPIGTDVISPYKSGDDIPGADAKVNRYIGLYEVDASGKVVKFRLIVLNEGDVKPAPTSTPAPGFMPVPKPEPGTKPGTTGIPNVTPGTDNHLVVKVSSVIIATPNVGDNAPTGTDVISPYKSGDDIPGADAKVNRYIGLYEVDASGKVVKFRLIVLNEEDVKPAPTSTPAPGFTPVPKPEPGTKPGTTGIPNVTPGTNNHLVVKVSAGVIATPNVGDNAPTGTDVISPYKSGDDIPGADAKVNRYIGLYEVDASGKVVKFRLIVLNEEDVKPAPTSTPVPGFMPVPKPEPGTKPGTTGIPNVTPGTNNHLVVKVSSVIIATPNVGDNAPTGTDVISPYKSGDAIPGADAKVNRYIGLYEVDASGKVVKFRLIVLNEEDVKPAPTSTPVPGFTPIPKPEPGTKPGTTGIPNVTPGTNNHLVVKVSAGVIATPNVGDNAPTGMDVISPYKSGDAIPGADAKVNRYIGLYEVDASGKVVKFRLIVLNEEDVKPAPTSTPVPGFTPMPKPEPGTKPGTTGIPNVTPGTNNHLVVKVSAGVIATPNVGDNAPTGTDVINPYKSGDAIPGADTKVNRYIGMYEVDASGKVVKFRLIVLNEGDVKPLSPSTPAPGFTPVPKPEPGKKPGTTGIPNVTPGTNNHLVVKVSTGVIETPNVGDNAPTGTGVINPYTTGDDIPGVDVKVNRYVGVYEIDETGKVVKFQLIVLNEEDITPVSDYLKQDQELLAIGYQTGDNENKVTKTLYLPVRGQSGKTSITWTTNDADHVRSNGRISRPGVDEQDVFVTLTAVIKDDTTGAVTTKVFVVKVIKMTDEEAVREAARNLTVDNGFTFAQGDTWESVTRDILMLGQGLYGTSITWSSTDTATIGIAMKDGQASAVIHRPQSRDKNVVLTATISRGKASITKTFLLVVNNLTVTKVDDETRKPTARNAEATVNPNGTPSSDQFVILRTKLSDGTNIDTVIVDPVKLEQLTDRFNPGDIQETNRTVELRVRQPLSNPADEIAVEIPGSAILALADRNGLLVIRTDEGIIKLSSDELKRLANQGTDLYFRLVPVHNNTEQQEANDALHDDSQVKKAAEGKQIQLLGIPRKIETNLTGSPSKVVLPLSNALLSGRNPSSLRVFVEHTDGTKELLSGVIQYENGNPTGIEIQIDRFSRFQVISFDEIKTNHGEGAGAANKLIDLILNGALQRDTASMKEKASDAARIIVDNEAIIGRLAGAPTGSVLTVPQVTEASGVDIVLNGKLLKRLIQLAGTLRIESVLGTYTVPVAALNSDKLFAALGNPEKAEDVSITFTIALADPSIVEKMKDMAKANGALLTGGPVQFAIKAELNGKTVSVDQFDRYVQREIRIPADVQTSAVTTGVSIALDGSLLHMPTRFESRDGQRFAVISSMYNGPFTLFGKKISFNDAQGHWAAATISDLAARNVVTGATNDKFEPNRSITRAEFAAILVRALGLKSSTVEGQQFSDVGRTAWYYDVVAAASEFKLVNGYTDGKFKPTARITREEAMAMLARAMKLTGLHKEMLPEAGEALLASFTDAKDAADWARESLTETLEAGIVQGRTKQELAPRAEIKRAEVATMILRLLRASSLI